MFDLLWSASPSDYVLLIVRLSAVGVVLSSLEWLFRRRYLAESGLMAWRISRLDHSWQVRGRAAPVLTYVLSGTPFLVLIAVRLGVSGIEAVGPRSVVLNPGLVCLAGVLALAFPTRSRYGLDAADQVATFVFLGLGLALLAGTLRAQETWLWFLTLQCVLSYVVAGAAKFSSHGWRNGQYLPGILSMRTYCPPMVSRFARRHSRLMWLMSWSVILWECCFFLVLLLPSQFAVVFIAIGLSFHLGTALIMGLNDFLWAFPAMYPAVLFCVSVRPWI